MIGATPSSTSSSSSSSSSTSPAALFSSDSFDPEESQAAAAQAAREAYMNGTLGFGFSAGGLLFPFYCGVVDELVRCGVVRETTPLAGASAGSLIVACARRWVRLWVWLGCGGSDGVG